MEKIKLYFDEEFHRYTDENGREYKSVTTLLHDYVPKFKKDYWLKKKAEELKTTEEALEKQWNTISKEACLRGSNIHGFIESGIKGSSQFAKAVKYLFRDKGEMITVYDIPTLDAEYRVIDIDEFIEQTNGKYEKLYALMRKYVEHGYKLYSEIGVFLPEYLLSGTIDVLCYRPDRFQILDWKTNRGGLIFKSGYYQKDKSHKPAQQTNIWVDKDERLLPPLGHLPNCNGYVYSLQLSLYARMVEMMLEIPCIGLCLCHIDCDFELNEYGMPKRFEDGLYHIKENPVERLTFYKIPYLSNEINRILTDRKNVVDAMQVTEAFQ